MRIPRLTTRRLMAIAACVAIAVEASRRVDQRRAMAHCHAWAEEEGYCSLYADLDFGFCSGCAQPGINGLLTPSRKSEYHHRMKHKWLYAASRPWLPVSPDPPEPE
jgi:hypothetical protein